MSAVYTTEATQRLSRKLQREGLNYWVACSTGDTCGKYLLFEVGGKCVSGLGWSIREARAEVDEMISQARSDTMPIKLQPGRTWDSDMEFAGWTTGDGSSTEGYCVAHYFDHEGRYLGPDVHGIEPVFSRYEVELSK